MDDKQSNADLVQQVEDLTKRVASLEAQLRTVVTSAQKTKRDVGVVASQLPTPPLKRR